jgi:hypothetical protein
MANFPVNGNRVGTAVTGKVKVFIGMATGDDVAIVPCEEHAPDNRAEIQRTNPITLIMVDFIVYLSLPLIPITSIITIISSTLSLRL